MWMNFLEESYKDLLVLWFAYKKLICKQSYLDSSFKYKVAIRILTSHVINSVCF